MNIKIIAVGKIKEKYLLEAVKEYEKRLSKFCTLETIEVNAENILDENEYDKYKFLEAQKILKHIKEQSFVITLEIKGKSMSSEDFAKTMKSISSNGQNETIFIIGGANGLDKSISNIANLRLSFSDLTFTHQLMRVILLEQIYRSFKINANENYHR